MQEATQISIDNEVTYAINKDSIEFAVKEIIADVLINSNDGFAMDVILKDNANLDNLGLDSMDKIDILLSIGKKFCLNIDATNCNFTIIKTIGDLCNMVKQLTT